MRKQIYTGVDIFKLLAAIGVVAIHAGAVVLNTLGRLGVPFFAIVSSTFFFKKYLSLQKQNGGVRDIFASIYAEFSTCI